MKRKKEYKVPKINFENLNMEDILTVSTGENHDIFDFDDEL